MVYQAVSAENQYQLLQCGLADGFLEFLVQAVSVQLCCRFRTKTLYFLCRIFFFIVGGFDVFQFDQALFSLTVPSF